MTGVVVLANVDTGNVASGCSLWWHSACSRGADNCAGGEATDTVFGACACRVVVTSDTCTATISNNADSRVVHCNGARLMFMVLIWRHTTNLQANIAQHGSLLSASSGPWFLQLCRSAQDKERTVNALLMGKI